MTFMICGVIYLCMSMKYTHQNKMAEQGYVQKLVPRTKTVGYDKVWTKPDSYDAEQLP